MEDDKLAAYYDELTQKGGGAARFKQGLGFSSTTPANNTVPPRGSALPTTSSFLSSFVKASSPTTSSSFQKQAQLESIQNKLKKAPNVKPPNQDKNSRNSTRRSRSRSPDRDKTRDSHSRRRSRSQSRSPVRYSRRHSRSRSRSQSPNSYSRHRHRSRDRRARRRSRSREDYGSRRKHQSRSRSRERERERRSKKRSWSGSPGQRKEKGRKRGEKKNGGGGGGRVDYTKLIEGYDKMTPAERVKAKMKLQLSETAEKDKTRGTGSGWERFDFNKDAPLDDEEIEAVEDDAALVKHLGQSFRFSVVEAKKEEDIKAAHDEAMFGASSLPLHAETDNEEEEDNNTDEENEGSPVKSLLSNQVLTMQQGSWRDRARKG